jgi:hypothetical protein
MTVWPWRRIFSVLVKQSRETWRPHVMAVVGPFRRASSVVMVTLAAWDGIAEKMDAAASVQARTNRFMTSASLF